VRTARRQLSHSERAVSTAIPDLFPSKKIRASADKPAARIVRECNLHTAQRHGNSTLVLNQTVEGLLSSSLSL
jgi:hypothetical protein